MKRKPFLSSRSSLVLFAAGALLFQFGCLRQESVPVAPEAPASLSMGPAPEYIAVLRENEFVNVPIIAQRNGFNVVDSDPEGEIIRYTTSGDPSAPEFEVYQPNQQVVLHGPISGAVYIVGSEVVVGEDQDALQCMRLSDCHAASTGDRIRVALFDTGVDDLHPDLQGRVTMLDHPVLGRASLDPNGVSWWHGTAMAGLILTVAPQATVYPYKIIDRTGTGTDFELAVALRSATLLGVDLISASISSEATAPVIDHLMQEAVDAGIIIVAAAGNNTSHHAATFPASSPRAVGVAGLAGGPVCNVIDDYSAHGPAVDFAAVGTGVISAYPGGEHASSTGTSNSAALTTGAIAAVLEQMDPLDHFDAVVHLRANAGPVSTGGTVGSGVVDLATALGQ